MSRSIHSIARHFLNKDSVEQCSLHEIRDLVEKHPYSAPIQYLLLEKIRTEYPEAYSLQVQKTILYYHDPLAFQFLLDPGRFDTEIEDSPDPVTTSEFSENIASEVPQETGIIELHPENSPVQEIETVPFESNDIEAESQIEVKTENTEPEVLSDSQTEKESAQEVLAEEKENFNEASQNTADQTQEPSIRPLKITSAQPGPNDLVFDPYHTVDYFASQGIKLSQDEFSKDKFGKQLKSFTEWLKSMKRLPANEVIPTVDSKTEDKVHHLAEDSIHQSEVYTEAMADVWLKQGNKAKAIEVYNKLSLLNPSKKAYFAAQIENLKQS